MIIHVINIQAKENSIILKYLNNMTSGSIKDRARKYKHTPNMMKHIIIAFLSLFIKTNSFYYEILHVFYSHFS